MSNQKKRRTTTNEEGLDAQMLKAASCPVCLCIFTNPVILHNCGHSLCFECAESILSHSDTDSHLVCPECRVLTDLGSNGVGGLKSNFSALRVSELLGQGTEADRSPFGERCRHYGAPSKTMCPHCDRYFCQGCLVGHVERLKMTCSWFSSSFEQRLSEVSPKLEKEIDKCNRLFEDKIEDHGRKIDHRFKNLLVEFQEVLESCKQMFLQDLENYKNKELERIQNVFCCLSCHNFEMLKGKVRSALQVSPLFGDLNFLAETHKQVVEMDSSLRAAEKLLRNEILQVEFLTGAHSEYLAEELGNLVRHDFWMESCLDTDDTMFEVKLLREACEIGDLGTVKSIFKGNSSPPGCIKFITSFLLDDSHCSTPLSVAASSGNLELIKYLIEEQHAEIWSMAEYWRSGKCSILENDGQLAILKYVIDKEPALLRVKLVNDGNLLHWAAQAGLVDAVKFLVQQKGFDVNSKDSKSSTPLLDAYHCPAVLKLLVELGADVSSEDNFGMTILSKLAQVGDLETFKYFYFLTGTTWSLSEPLRLSVAHGHCDLVEFVIDHFVVDDECKRMMLELAIENCRLPIVQFLVDLDESVLAIRFEHGNSTLHAAVSYSELHLPIVSYLLSKSPQLLIATNVNSERPLEVALRRKNLTVARYLLSFHLFEHDITRE